MQLDYPIRQSVSILERERPTDGVANSVRFSAGRSTRAAYSRYATAFLRVDCNNGAGNNIDDHASRDKVKLLLGKTDATGVYYYSTVTWASGVIVDALDIRQSHYVRISISRLLIVYPFLYVLTS